MINRFLEVMLALLLIAAVGVAFVAVIFRYVLASSLSWSFEVSLALLTYITFLGCCLALRQGAHLRVTLLTDKLPLWAKGPLFLATQLLIVMIGGIMVWEGSHQILKFSGQKTSVLEISVAWYYAAIPASGLLIVAESLFRIVTGAVLLWQGRDPDPPQDTGVVSAEL